MGKQSATQDIGNVVDAYRKAYGTIEEEKSALDDYYADKLKMINAIIDPEEKKLVSDVKKEIDVKINSWREQLKTLNGTELEQGSIAYADEKCKKAQKDRDEKGEKYDELKKTQKSIEEELKKLNDLKQSIEMEEEEGTFKDVNMCFLISEMHDKMTEIGEIISVESLETKLYQAWKDLDTAKENLKTKEADLKKIKDKRDQIKKELEEAEKTRKEEILDEIHIRTLQESQE